jgi:hypothetical protein
MDEAPALERLTRSAFYREGATVRLLVRWIVRGPAGACELYLTHDLSTTEAGVLALMQPWTSIPCEAQVHVHSYAERAWSSAAQRDDCDLLGGSCFFDARHAFGKTMLIGALDSGDPDVYIYEALESLYGDDLEVGKQAVYEGVFREALGDLVARVQTAADLSLPTDPKLTSLAKIAEEIQREAETRSC